MIEEPVGRAESDRLSIVSTAEGAHFRGGPIARVEGVEHLRWNLAHPTFADDAEEGSGRIEGQTRKGAARVADRRGDAGHGVDLDELPGVLARDEQGPELAAARMPREPHTLSTVRPLSVMGTLEIVAALSGSTARSMLSSDEMEYTRGAASADDMPTDGSAKAIVARVSRRLAALCMSQFLPRSADV